MHRIERANAKTRTSNSCLRGFGRQPARFACDFFVTIDRDEDGMWIVECPAIPGCVSQGKSKDEAMASIEAAIKLCLEVRAEQGLPLTVETRQIEVSV